MGEQGFGGWEWGRGVSFSSIPRSPDIRLQRSFWTDIHKPVTKITATKSKYSSSFLHFLLLKNDPCHSSVYEILSNDGNI